MSVALAPPIVFQSILSNGAPNAFGFVYTYIAGTTTPQATWPDATQTTPNTNPVQLNAFGQASIWLATNLVYKMIVTDALGNQIGFQDQVPGGVFAAPISIGTSLIPTPSNTYNLGSPTNSWAQLYIGPNQAPVYNTISGIVGFYPTLSGEVGVTNSSYLYGYSARYGMIPDGTTDCTTNIQNWITSANALGVPAIVPLGLSFYKSTSRVTVPGGTQIIGQGYRPEIKWTATTPTGSSYLGSPTRPGFEVTGDNVEITGLKITGPQTVAAGSGAGGGGVGTYVFGEIGVFRKGTSSAARGKGLTLNDCEISLWGYGGTLSQFVQNHNCFRNLIHDVGYVGIMKNSNLSDKEHFNIIWGVSPGNSGNAYGISHNHDSTNYNTDPLVNAPISGITAASSAVITITTVSGTNPYSVGQDVQVNGVAGMTQINGQFGQVTAIGGSSGAWTVTLNINSGAYTAYGSGGIISCPKQATNPFCTDMDCGFNTIFDIPLWSAYDAHGCWGGRYHDNTSANCYIHYQIASGSNAALGYAGINNSITNNSLEYDQLNGNASTITSVRGSGVSRSIITNGGSPSVSATVTGITAAASAVVTISTVSGSNPFAVGQLVTFTLVQGMTQINGVVGVVSATGGSSGAWTITVSINSSAFSAYTSGGTMTLYFVTQKNVVIGKNRLNGPFGDPTGFSGTARCIEWAYCNNAVVEGNEFYGFNGAAIYAHHSDGSISNNQIGSPSTAANSVGIYLQGNCGEITAVGNKHSPQGGNVLATGMDVNTTNMTRMLVINDFNSATAAYGTGMALLTRGKSDIAPRIQVTNSTGGSQTVDVSPAGNTDDVYVEFSPGAAFNLTGFLNSPVGQRIWTNQSSTNSVTVLSHTNGGTQYIGGAGNAVMTQFSTMGFLTKTSGLQYEISRMLSGQ